MPEVLTLIQSFIHEEDVAALDEFGLFIRSQIGMSPGYLSLSVWKDADFPERYLTIMHLNLGPDEAVIPLNIADAPEFETLSQSHLAPPDIRVLQVRQRHAGTPAQVEVGGFLSLSMRKSEPGYSVDLSDELADIFESLRYIEGYIGSLIGPNLAVQEEVLGAVLWTNRRAFDASIPGTTPYEVRLFERIS